MESNNKVRLQKYLADNGIDSRRKCEEFILAGRVKVNGQVVTELGTKVDILKDKVFFDNKLVHKVHKKVYYMLNKPEGYITTSKEQLDRPCVMDLIGDINERVFPVGRLDMDTSGLLLLTNDGDFAYTMTHPKHNISKRYIASIVGTPTSSEMDKFRKGLKIEDYTTSPAEIRLISSNSKTSRVDITIHEGKNRQIKKMCEAIGHRVVKLKRIQIGELELGDLEIGKYKELKKHHLDKLMCNYSTKDIAKRGKRNGFKNK